MADDVLDAVKVLSLATSQARRVMTAQCAARGAEGDDENAERFDGVEIAQPVGLMAQPALTATTEALAVRHGDELIALFVIDKGAQVQAVEPGETRLYGAGTQNASTVIRLRSNGALDMTSANNGAVNISAHGTGVLNLQDASQPFVRGTTYADAMGTFLDAAKVVMTAVGAFATAAGPAPAAVTLNIAIVAFNIACDAMKASRTAYLSTKIRGQ